MEKQDTEALPPIPGGKPQTFSHPEVSNGSAPNDDATILADLKARRKELNPFGKTHTLEVPGYKGLLGIEYNYIDTEVTEEISNELQRELRHVNGKGMTLLASIETLLAACKRVVVRGSTDEEWRDFPGKLKLELRLADTLGYTATDEREVVLGLFGSDHSIIQQNVQLSRWLADVTRETSRDFMTF